MDVVGCVGVTFLVVFWVVFGGWLAFLVAFGSGVNGLFSLVCMGLCWFLRVVVVSACWVCFGFSLVCGFLGGFLLLVIWWVRGADVEVCLGVVSGCREQLLVFYGNFLGVLDDSNA